jgi:hypothetical protein
MWKGYRNRYGYGILNVRHRPLQAHRWSYERFVGPIPEGLHIDRLCRNRARVNPKHLEPVTPADNTRRGNSPAMIRVRSGTCGRGHEYNDANTYLDKEGKRHCRICGRERKRSERQKRKEDDER